MTALKTLTALLLGANLVFLTWAQGWWSPWLPPPGAREREPERLRLQVRPEAVIVLSPQAVSAAMAPPPPPAENSSQGEMTEVPPPADRLPEAGRADQAATVPPVVAGQNPRGPEERRQPGR